MIVQSGLSGQGAAKNGELCGTMKVNCVAKKYQLCSKLCGSQFLILKVWGVLNSVLIGLLVYLSNGIDTISCLLK